MAHRKPGIDKACTYCGETFACQHGHRKFCSDKCRFEADNKRASAYYHSKREPRKMETRQCSYCKEDFDTKNCQRVFCCPQHRILAGRKKVATPEGRAKHRKYWKRDQANKKAKEGGWTAKERKAYGSQYWFDITKPRLQREKEAEALSEVPDKIPYSKIQRLYAEQIVRYWGRII